MFLTLVYYTDINIKRANIFVLVRKENRMSKDWEKFNPRVIIMASKGTGKKVLARKCGGGSCIGGNCKSIPANPF